MKHLSTAFLLLIIFSFTNLQAQWTQTNGPLGGTIWCFAVHDSILFAGTNGGVFRSTDFGRSWTQANNGLAINSGIGSIVVKDSNLIAGGSNGVYISKDNGESWTSINQGLPFSTNTLLVKDTNIFAGTFTGIYLSTNNGASWKESDSGITNKNINSLAVKDTNIFAATNDGIFRSTNNGLSWSIIDTGIFNTNIACIAVKGDSVFAGTSVLTADTNNTGIFLSTDNGKTWKADNHGLPYGSLPIFSLTVIGEEVYAASSGTLYRLGGTWYSISNGLTRGGVHAIASIDTTMFAGNDDGVFISLNKGASWTESDTGLIATNVKGFSINGTKLFAATGSIFLKSNKNMDWSLKTDSLLGINCLLSDTTNLFAGGAFGIYLSTDSGATWTTMNTGLPKNTFVNTFLIKDKKIFAGVNGGIFVSTDNGSNWDSAYTGLPQNIVVSSLALKDTIIFAGTHGGVFSSSDDGANWSAVNNGLTDTYINCIAASDSNIFAGCNKNGIFKSTDNGANWTQVNSGITPLYSAYAIAIDSINIFAGTNVGVYLSQNSGADWRDVSSGIKYTSDIKSLAYDNTYLYAGTYGNGVWQRPLAEIVTAIKIDKGNMPEEFSLYQNYPNPFNPATTIIYQIPKSSLVTLKVYDVLGKAVKTLVNEYQIKGKYSINFDASSLASGVYFYRLSSGSFAETKKLILLK